jgi:anti-sigma regulatory factor (Ser/Thr protein kinase)
MILVSCPQCNRQYKLADDAAGKFGNCKCGNRFKIVAPTTSVAGGSGAHQPVFVSYANEDIAIALSIWNTLERSGIRAWMAPQSITPGTDYGEAIIGAINTCRLLVLVLSDRSNASHQVKFEIERAASKRKPIIPFRIHPLSLSPSLEYFLSSFQWLDAFPVPLEPHLERLVQVVQNTISLSQEGATSPPQPPVAVGPPDKTASPPEPRTGLRDSWRQSLKAGEVVVETGATAAETRSTLQEVFQEALLSGGFVLAEARKCVVVLNELLNNVIAHTGDPSAWCRVTLRITANNTQIEVEDHGKGFDLDAMLKQLAARLEEGEREHGLLRAVRYGNVRKQRKTPAHALTWVRMKRPQTLPSIFDQFSGILPLVFDYSLELCRIGREIYHTEELTPLVRLGAGVRRIVFDELRRSAAPLIGLEVRGQHHTRVGFDAGEFALSIWDYRTREIPAKPLIVFVDSEPEDHSFFEELSKGAISRNQLLQYELGMIPGSPPDVSLCADRKICQIIEDATLCAELCAKRVQEY